MRTDCQPRVATCGSSAPAGPFTPIYDSASRPSLWSNQIKESVFQLSDEMRFSQEMKENSSFSRASITKEFSVKGGNSVWELLGITPWARNLNLRATTLLVLGRGQDTKPPCVSGFPLVNEDNRSACLVRSFRRSREDEVRTVPAHSKPSAY